MSITNTDAGVMNGLENIKIELVFILPYTPPDYYHSTTSDVNCVINICLRRKRKRRDATGKLDYDRPADYNLPLVPHPPGNCTVSFFCQMCVCSIFNTINIRYKTRQIRNSRAHQQPVKSWTAPRLLINRRIGARRRRRWRLAGRVAPAPVVLDRWPRVQLRPQSKQSWIWSPSQSLTRVARPILM